MTAPDKQSPGVIERLYLCWDGDKPYLCADEEDHSLDHLEERLRAVSGPVRVVLDESRILTAEQAADIDWELQKLEHVAKDQNQPGDLADIKEMRSWLAATLPTESKP